MAHSRLHIICGNCGCNDMFEYEIVLDGMDFGDYYSPSSYIWCKNCSTLHTIDSFMPPRNMQKITSDQMERIEKILSEENGFNNVFKFTEKQINDLSKLYNKEYVEYLINFFDNLKFENKLKEVIIIGECCSGKTLLKSFLKEVFNDIRFFEQTRETSLTLGKPQIKISKENWKIIK